MQKLLISIVVVMLSAGPVLCGEGEAPWWKQQKLRVMWGQWAHAREDKSKPFHDGDLPRELFRNVAQAGGTVFVEHRGGCKLNHARHAHAFGMKYFATQYVSDLSGVARKMENKRWCVTREGGHNSGPAWFPCPLFEPAYEQWIVEPHLDGLREGLIDGIHFDWEPYGGRDEAGICFCNDCFSSFPEFKQREEELPEKLKRFAWLAKHNLIEAYEENFSKRRIEMFTRIRETLQAANSDLLFSSYDMIFSDFSQAMNTPDTPFVVLDARHYMNDDRQPWWDSYGTRLRQEGYLYIPGGWTNALFGAQASQVSAARWIYEASINEDGCWLWFERELDDEILRAYATADRKLKAVQGKVGRFLFGGTRDPNFVTAVEWTGRPELERAVITAAYHLDNEHLLHVNNVDTDWPVRVRLRFPRLPEGDRWTVRDAMNDLYCAHGGASAIWTRDDLLSGVVVSLEPRSDLFLVVSPPPGEFNLDRSNLIPSHEFSVLPEHEAASKAAGPIKTIIKLYHMKNAIYEKNLETLLAATENVFDLPKDGWRFKMDKQDVGTGDGWHLPASPMEDWLEIETEAFWGSKGGAGAGWYRRDIDVPALPEGKRVYLHFGAVDEQMVLWIDGAYAGDYDRESGEGWDQPFAIDVTGKLTAGKHHLAVRVDNATGAGGVWKPVSVRAVGDVADAEKAPPADVAEAARPGGLLYTATEPMGFGGAEGGLTIGNVIRTIDTGGQTQQRLRQLRGHLWSPTYSPDGKRIAFVHDVGGRGQIFVMNADGSGATNISDNSFCDRSPVWSPDGGKIAFVSDRDGDWEIYTMNADRPAGAGRRLSGNSGLDRAPAWSPDGKRIAWESHVSSMPNIWVCDADGGNAQALIEPGKALTIREVRAWKDPVEIVEVEPVFADNTMYLWDPVWSPDGMRIAAGALHTVGGETVALLQADGSSLVQLIYGIVGVANVTWSPDGTQLAGTLRTAPQETERSGVFVVRADGTDKYRWLVDVTPRGPRLGGASRRGVMSWYSHGSAQPRRVLKTFTSLAWSPDGGRLAFSADLDPSGSFDVYSISPDGGEPNRLDGTQSAWPQQIMWRPR